MTPALATRMPDSMPHDKLETVRAAFEAWGSPSWFDFFAADIEWEVRPDLPDASVYRGHDGVRRLVARFTDVMSDMWFEPEELIEAGEDQVVVPLRWGGKGMGSGMEFEERRETWVFTVRDGRIARIKEFATRDEALEAAGLSA
jgi:ketosteroid isomerase-like protein